MISRPGPQGDARPVEAEGESSQARMGAGGSEDSQPECSQAPCRASEGGKLMDIWLERVLENI